MAGKRSIAALLALVAGGALAAQPSPSARGREGGFLQIAFSPASGLDSVDPALSFTQPGWSLLDTTCARLFTYPDKPPPAAYRLQPEVVAGWKVSKDFKTYTFRLRPGFRFSDGKQLQANAFAHAGGLDMKLKLLQLEGAILA